MYKERIGEKNERYFRYSCCNFSPTLFWKSNSEVLCGSESFVTLMGMYQTKGCSEGRCSKGYVSPGATIWRAFVIPKHWFYVQFCSTWVEVPRMWWGNNCKFRLIPDKNSSALIYMNQYLKHLFKRVDLKKKSSIYWVMILNIL